MEVCASDDAKEKVVSTLAAAWVKIMDRSQGAPVQFDVAERRGLWKLRKS